ncbi:hypothetical protein MRB53_003632 [Persea americana]|uniref:Uncharacterized protein n=1 Tax=Persea americana TaxID=3435 RepID=A0ACC2MZK2_PERAE|nr:hypothetical protein MRB53_003632 [Persea americana]
MAVSASEALLRDTVYGAVDYKGSPVTGSTTGGWKLASFIIGVEMAERFAYYGISSNLISYLTWSLHQSTAAAAENCVIETLSASSCPSPSQFQLVFFFLSLYFLALAEGGFKPCVQAFGADQLGSHNPEESKSKSSFFNWWYFGSCCGNVVSLWILNYIQDNLSWGLGFGVPCISMMLALVVFLLGTKTYRYYMKEEKNPFMSILVVLVAAALL